MGDFLSTAFGLLTSDAGSLTYHLVLAFTLAGALQAAFASWRQSEFPQGSRLIAGLILLLLVRVGLFAAAGLAWTGQIGGPLLLPLLDRAAALLSLLLIIWLWAFPEPSRLADSATLLIGLLLITASALALTWASSPQTAIAGSPFGRSAPTSPLNGSLIDALTQAAALALCALGLLMLVARRPNGWVYGAMMLLMIAAGHFAHLAFLPEPRGDVSGVVRFAQLAAFPLLLLLPTRFPIALPVSPLAALEVPPPAATPAADSRLDLLPSFLSLLDAAPLPTQSDPATAAQNARQAAARALAVWMQADLVLLIDPTPPAAAQSSGGYAATPDALPVIAAYDARRGPLERLPSTPLDARTLPLLAPSLRRGKPLRLPASSTSPDMAALSLACDLDRTGHLLASPALVDGQPVLGAVLLSPYSNRGWTRDDQERLSTLVAPLARFLHLSAASASASQPLQETALAASLALKDALQRLEAAEAELSALRLGRELPASPIPDVQNAWVPEDWLQERQTLIDELEALHKAARQDRAQLEDMASMVATGVAARQALDSLQEENNRLKASAAASTSARSQVEQLEGELRLALQEIAQLQMESASAAMSAPSTALGSPRSDTAAAALADDLRQPLASILSYTDFLLGESIGILSANQRKFLERVRLSAERLQKLSDDLLLKLSPDDLPQQLSLEPVDLGRVMDAAVAEARQPFSQKRINLRLDLPDDLPAPLSDRAALQGILATLLRNAALVTPPQGQAQLRLSLQRHPGEDDYLLLQVVDSGPSIPVGSLPRVFAPRPVSALDGEGPVNLAPLKTQIERIGGRIWVENNARAGVTYSLLLPVMGLPPGNGRGPSLLARIQENETRGPA